jgi:hypothetical protein
VQLDPQLRALLAKIRRQVRRYIVADSLLAIVAFVSTAFWLGFLIDYLPVRLGGTEMPRSARTVLLAGVVGAIVFLLARLLLGRLRKPLHDDSLALLVERQHPELGGRLVTAVQLTQAKRTGDMHEPSLLRKVHSEAAAAIDKVEIGRIFRWQPIWRKLALALPLGIATVAFASINPDAFARASGRLLLLTDSPWPRRAELAMVGVELPTITADDNDDTPPKLVEFTDKTLRLPQGSSGVLRVLAKAEDAIVPDVCTVYYTTQDGTRGQANMRRVGRVVEGAQAFVLDGPPLAGISESVRLSVRGLDSRLDDYSIEAVPPPAITEIKVVSVDPAYLKPDDGELPTTRESTYQSGLRVREGSTVELVGTSTTPLGRVDVRLLRGNQATVAADAMIAADGMSFKVPIEDMREPATVIVVPEDKTGIAAQLPYRYFLGVIIDDAPDLEMRLKGIGSAVTPIARIPIRGKATDDYGIDEAKIELAIVAAKPADDATVEPKESGIAKLEEPTPGTTTSEPITLDRDGNFELAVDLRAMNEAKRFIVPDPAALNSTSPNSPAAAQGSAINLFAEVSDRYDLNEKHLSKSELFRLEIVTAEKLLMLLERRELGMRARLEQAIDETRGLRDSLDGLRREILSPKTQSPEQAEAASNEVDTETGEDASREQQIFRVRAQQNGLQATKTSEELSGIAASLDDLLEEMQNNRVDSVDRSERIGKGVRDPLREIVAGDLTKLRGEIAEAEKLAAEPAAAADKTGQAVQTAEDVLLQLTAVLEKMLDLESFNEILDMVRELIDSQDGLLEETKKEQKRKLQDLFK